MVVVVVVVMVLFFGKDQEGAAEGRLQAPQKVKIKVFGSDTHLLRFPVVAAGACAVGGGHHHHGRHLLLLLLLPLACVCVCVCVEIEADTTTKESCGEGSKRQFSFLHSFWHR